MNIIIDNNDGSVLLLDPDLNQSIAENMKAITIDDKWRKSFGQSASYRWDSSNNNLIITPIINGPTSRELVLSDVKDNYDIAITRLDTIIANGNTFTATQVRDAVVDLARIERRLLRFVKEQIT